MTPLSDASLRRICDSSALGFATTDEVEPLDEIAGQPRAVAALELAVGGGLAGHHAFVTGAPGTGRRTAAESFLRRAAARRGAPPDRVYVHNFAHPEHPRALALPPGRGPLLRQQVTQLVDDSLRRLSEAFESDSYRVRHQHLHASTDSQRQTVLGRLQKQARARGVALELTPVGAVTLPIVDGKAVAPPDAERLPPERLQAHRAAVEQLDDAVGEAFARLRALDREEARAHRELDRELASFAIGHLSEEVAAGWPESPAVGEWLQAMEEDLLATVPRLRAQTKDGSLPSDVAQAAGGRLDGELSRYEVNVLVTHDPAAGAPVEVCTNPNSNELFGCLEYEAALGVARTDHRRIRAGAVHRASGGYLLIDAADALTRPFAWPRLKELLRTRSARIENAGRELMLLPTPSLEPEPIEVELTVVLVGSPLLYHLLLQLDEDVPKLFKVRADFDVEMPWDDAGERVYAALVARRVRDGALPPFEAGAVAALIEHGARVAEQRDRLTTRLGEIAAVADEAALRAVADGDGPVRAEHVEQALRARRHRSDLIEERMYERLRDGTLNVQVTGAAAGQVNGLAVIDLGDHRFGYPARITATVSPGKGDVLDIDREAELSGPIHTKGVLILSGFLRGRYAADAPLGLQASIVFEQSYGPVEGDSASSAELYALVSALAQLPLRQDVAVTGSVDQRGRLQAIGGVNEKIEGFFAVCRERGLTGDQGVIIPAANLANLMLDREVVDAVRDGRFSVWALQTVDEALELLTGLEAGAATDDGDYPEDSVNGRAQRRALELYEAARPKPAEVA